MDETVFKKIRRDPYMKELRAKRKRSKNSQRWANLSDIYCEMGDYLRRICFETMPHPSKNFQAKIVGKYRNAIEMGMRAKHYENCSLAYRALAEIAMDDNANEAFNNIENSMRYALKARNSSFIQLAFHQCAYIFSTAPEYLKKAAEIAERGLVYLNDHAAEIDADPSAVTTGGDSKRRRAGLENLLGGIYLDLEDETTARLHNDHCLDYASASQDRELHCRALLLKLRMTSGKDRLEVAIELKTISDRIMDKNSAIRFEADFHLGTERLRANDLVEAKRILWKLYVHHLARLDEDTRPLVDKYLVFIYKTERRVRRIAALAKLSSSESCINDQLCAQINEKIADEAADLQLNELAFNYYERMLISANNMNQKRLALQSLAETARELRDFEAAAQFFRDLLKIERRLGYSNNKLLATEISIAIVSANLTSISFTERLSLFQTTYAKCHTTADQEYLLSDYVKFLEGNKDLCDPDFVAEKRRELEQLRKLPFETDSEDLQAHCFDKLRPRNRQIDIEEMPYMDELDDLNELEVFNELKVEMKQLEEEIQLMKSVDAIVNKDGETRLHVVARSNDYDMLKRLVKAGYNVNAKDYAGWTPLSEAVVSGNLRNARYLLQNGANVNSRSTVGLVNEENEEIASGYSPLMEACSNGDIDLIRMLLAFKASVTQTNDEGWTAVDFLREFLDTKLTAAENDDDALTPQIIEKIRQCIAFMEKLQLKAGITPRSSPPRHLQKRKFVPGAKRKRAAFEDDDKSKNDLKTLGQTPTSGNPAKRASKNPLSMDGFNSDDSMDQLLASLCANSASRKSIASDNIDTTTAVSVNESEDERNLREYRRMMDALGRRDIAVSPTTKSTAKKERR